jgi:hypothetical protein
MRLKLNGECLAAIGLSFEARRQAQISKSERKRNGPGDFFPNNFQFAQHLAGTVLPP